MSEGSTAALTGDSRPEMGSREWVDEVHPKLKAYLAHCFPTSSLDADEVAWVTIGEAIARKEKLVHRPFGAQIRWLKAVGHNRAVDLLRRQKRNPWVTLRDDVEGPSADTQDYLDEAVRDGCLRLYRKLRRKLPEELSKALELRGRGVSYRAIAAVMDPELTPMAGISRARRRVKEASALLGRRFRRMGLDLGPWEQGDLRGLLRGLPEGPRVVAVAELYYLSLKDFHEIGEICFNDLPPPARAPRAKRLLCVTLVALQRRYLGDLTGPATGRSSRRVLPGPEEFFETPMKKDARRSPSVEAGRAMRGTPGGSARDRSPGHNDGPGLPR